MQCQCEPTRVCLGSVAGPVWIPNGSVKRGLGLTKHAPTSDQNQPSKSLTIVLAKVAKCLCGWDSPALTRRSFNRSTHFHSSIFSVVLIRVPAWVPTVLRQPEVLRRSGRGVAPGLRWSPRVLEESVCASNRHVHDDVKLLKTTIFQHNRRTYEVVSRYSVTLHVQQRSHLASLH